MTVLVRELEDIRVFMRVDEAVFGSDSGVAGIVEGLSELDSKRVNHLLVLFSIVLFFQPIIEIYHLKTVLVENDYSP